MPIVSKQGSRVTVVGKPRPPSANGSILSRAVPVEKLQEVWQNFVIYGRNRTGKTTLACHWPKPLLLVNFEIGDSGGAQSVKKMAGVEFVSLTTEAEALQLAEELECDTHYKSHVLDTATSFQEIVLRDILGYADVGLLLQKNWGALNREDYSRRAERTKKALFKFRNLKANTIILAQEKDHTYKGEETKLVRGLTFQVESFFSADVGGATAQWLFDACNYFGRLSVEREVRTEVTETEFKGKKESTSQEVETGRTVHRFRTMYNCNYGAGFRSCNPEAVPEYIDCREPKQMYDEIQRVIGGDRTKFGKYQE